MVRQTKDKLVAAIQKVRQTKNMLVAAIVIAGIGYIGFVGWMWYKVNVVGANDSDYSIVCIGGHEYWRASFVTKGFLAIKLDDEGNPINCQ